MRRKENEREKIKQKTEQSRLKTGRRELLHQRKRNKRNYKLFFFYWKDIIKTYTYDTLATIKEKKTCSHLYLDQGGVATCHSYIKESQVIVSGLFLK